jgi:hypothetical protein
VILKVPGERPRRRSDLSVVSSYSIGDRVVYLGDDTFYRANASLSFSVKWVFFRIFSYLKQPSVADIRTTPFLETKT